MKNQSSFRSSVNIVLLASHHSEFDDVTEADFDAMDMDAWDTLAETGELDVYTCVALCTGRHGLHSDQTKRYIPTCCILLAMQLILPVCLVYYQVSRVTYYTTNQSVLFRFIGFILYLFSIRSMYAGALDQCRSWVMTVMVDCEVSPGYIWPVLIGEFINAFVGCAMTVTTFLVYCNAPSVEELLLNCIAVTFITEIDDQMVLDWMKKAARDDFIAAMKDWRDDMIDKHQQQHDTPRVTLIRRGWKRWAHKWSHFVIKFVCKAIRIVGTVGTGMILALLFSLARLSALCQAVPGLQVEMSWRGLLCAARS